MTDFTSLPPDEQMRLKRSFSDFWIWSQKGVSDWERSHPKEDRTAVIAAHVQRLNDWWRDNTITNHPYKFGE